MKSFCKERKRVQYSIGFWFSNRLTKRIGNISLISFINVMETAFHFIIEALSLCSWLSVFALRDSLFELSIYTRTSNVFRIIKSFLRRVWNKISTESWNFQEKSLFYFGTKAFTFTTKKPNSLSFQVYSWKSNFSQA